MAAQLSPEAKELSLVGKVEMRIALADGDQKLQTTLNTYLAPLLLKLASEHMSVRNKVCSRYGHSEVHTDYYLVDVACQGLCLSDLFSDNCSPGHQHLPTYQH